MSAVDPSTAPILVLGSGHRTGSTLVQRLLTSHPDIMIWGEHLGFLRTLLDMTATLEEWDWGAAEGGRRAFDEGGHDGWIANMMPGRESAQEAARAYVRALFEQPAIAGGRTRWGLKEVRYTRVHAAGLQRLFEGLRAIHVTRDPRKMLMSLDSWERRGDFWTREYTARAIGHWVDVNRSFLDERPDWALSVRYEDITADPAAFVASVAELIGVEEGSLDRGVFDKKVRGFDDNMPSPRGWDELPRDLRKLLKDKRVREIADAYGYDL
jgi:hypothetical protein